MTPILPDLFRLLAPLMRAPYGHDWPDELDCTTLWAKVLREHYGRSLIDDFAWRAINLSEPDARPWDGIEELMRTFERGGALPHTGPELPPAGRLCLVQGWRRLSPEGAITPQSRGHLYGWLADPHVPWLGVCIEANRSEPSGVRLWDARGPRLLSDVITDDGELLGDIEGMGWSTRAGAYEQVAWVVVP